MEQQTSDQVAKRKELQIQLQTDENDLLLLTQNLQKADRLTVAMNDMLEAFDQRLSKLETTYILPIHKATSQVTKLHKNLNTCIDAISAYNNLLTTITSHESQVARGITETTSVATFISSILCLKNSLRVLLDLRYKSSEKMAYDLQNTLAKGITEIDSLFSTALTNACLSSPLNCFDDTDVEVMRIGGYTGFTSDDSLALKEQATFLAESLEQIGPISKLITVYIEVRSAALARALSTVNGLTKDQEVKMSYQRSVYKEGSSALIPYAKQVLAALKFEHDLVTSLIPKHHAITTFHSTTSAMIVLFIEGLSLILNRGKRGVQRRESMEISMIVDIWMNLDSIFASEPVLLYAGESGLLIGTHLTSFVQFLVGFLISAFDEFAAEDVKKTTTSLSADGTVNETTSNTVNFLKRVFENERQLDYMIGKLANNSIEFKFNKTEFKSLAEYANLILVSLLDEIGAKAKVYKKQLVNIFILNNCKYIIKTLKQSNLPALPHIPAFELEIKTHLELYRDSWVSIASHLIDQTKIVGGKIETVLSKAQRDTVKDQWKEFNKDFDEIVGIQSLYAVPDIELRAQVIKDVKGIIVPMYARFYDRYLVVEFSKTPEKYMRYSKEQLLDVLDKLFDSSK